MNFKVTLVNIPSVRICTLLLFPIFFIFLAKISSANIKTPSNPNSAKACAICHFRWIDTFFVEGKGTDLVDYSSEKVAASPAMCDSCHDGSVVDSRRKAYKNFMHKIDAPIPENIRIPEIFPLGENGSMQCATCHTPHAVPSGAGAQDSIFMRASNKNSSMCLKCHTGLRNIVNTKHNLIYTAAEERNLEGQTVSEAGPCSACHLQHAPARNLPGKEAFSTQLCFSCHSERNIAANFKLTGSQHPFNIQPIINNENLTLPLFSFNSYQMKNGMITCSTCHDPHNWSPDTNIEEIRIDVEGDSTNSFLRKPPPKLCEDCHPDKAYIEKTDHDLTVTAPASKNINQQEPEKSGVCGVCHLVHNSENEIVLWAQGFGPGNNIMETMCNSCHSAEGSAKQKIPPVYLHPREKLISIKNRNDFFPLFSAKTGKPAIEGNISCPSCHNVHQWDPEIPSMGKGMNLEGHAVNSFLRPRISFKLCAECHGGDAQSMFKDYHRPDKRKFKAIDELFFQ